jgi:RND family efflux transporter MFP subunit
MARCSADVTNAYYQNYLKIQQQLDKINTTGMDSNAYLQDVVPVRNARDSAYATYLYCAKFTDYEVNSSQAKLAAAQAGLKAAQATMDSLTANKGLDPVTLATDQAGVASAQIALDKAQAILDGATITAPFDGTILTVAGQVGDKFDTSTFITLADLSHPNVQFAIDQTDMDKVSVGETVQVTFDAISGKTFTGKVVRIDPALVTVSGYQAIQAEASIDMTPAGNITLPAGLNASVEVIGGQSMNTLLVPVEAIHDMGNGTYGVFVVDSTGKMTLTPVTVGLMDMTNAEIKSGLKLGQVVSTGIMETK